MMDVTDPPETSAHVSRRREMFISQEAPHSLCFNVQGGSNMTGTICV
jgi:hypothetical protein